jgi:hypothetical protein
MRGGNIYLTGNQLSWLAGLLEAEGSFLPGYPLRPRKVRVEISMTDLDVIQQVADLFGTSIRKQKPRKEHHKIQYGTVLVGGSAASLMKLLHPIMGLRCQSQIERALSCYNPILIFPHREFHLIDDVVPEHERYWLAGYVEGEGYFSLHAYPERRTKFRPQVETDSTDLDVIERVQRMWLTCYDTDAKIYAHKPSGKNAKMAYRISVQNDQARTIIRDLYPLLGERRQAKIRDILGDER